MESLGSGRIRSPFKFPRLLVQQQSNDEANKGHATNEGSLLMSQLTSSASTLFMNAAASVSTSINSTMLGHTRKHSDLTAPANANANASADLDFETWKRPVYASTANTPHRFPRHRSDTSLASTASSDSSSMHSLHVDEFAGFDYDGLPLPATSATTSATVATRTCVKRSVQRVMGTPIAKKLDRKFRNLTPTQRDQFLFTSSNAIGTILFFALFECMYHVMSFTLEQADSVFGVSYSVAYLISILWQHALNRVFVKTFSSANYWTSLLQTYIVYSITLAFITTVGGFLIRVWHFSPRFVTILTLPTSGVFNYYSLKFVMMNAQAKTPNLPV